MKLYFKLTEEAIRKSLVNGVELKKNQSIDVDFNELSKEDREVILRHCIVKDDQLFAGKYQKRTLDGFSKVYSVDDVVSLDGVTILEIISSFRKFEAEREQLAEIKRRDLINELSEFNSGAENNALGYKMWSDLSGCVNYDDFAKELEKVKKEYNLDDSIVKKAEQRMSELIKQAEQKKASLKAEADKTRRERERKEIKKQEQKEKLKNWAQENGSELLKLRIKHDQNWHDLAAYEYGLSILPDFDDDQGGYDDWWLINNATVDQLKMIDDLSQKYEGISFHLERCKYFGEHHELYHRSFIVAKIDVLTGTRDFFNEIEDVSESDDE